DAVTVADVIPMPDNSEEGRLYPREIFLMRIYDPGSACLLEIFRSLLIRTAAIVLLVPSPCHLFNRVLRELVWVCLSSRTTGLRFITVTPCAPLICTYRFHGPYDRLLEKPYNN